jgi:hypothetical protein
MRSTKSRHALYIRGLEEAPIRNVVVRDSAFKGVAQGHVIEGEVELTLDRVLTVAAPKETKQ